jgi:hypothetical protein
MDLAAFLKKYDFLLIIFLAYFALLFFHFNGLNHDWPTMGDNYYDVVFSIVKGVGLNKTDIFNECKTLYESNETLPLECKRHAFSAGKNGVYPSYSPGLSFLAVPYFSIINLFSFPEFIELSSLVFFNVMLSVILIFFIYKFSTLYLSEKNSKQVAYIFAFATIILTYSQTFWSDTLATLLIFSGFYYFKLFLSKKRKRYIIIAGLLSGYLFLTKTVLLIFPGILGIYLLFKEKKAAIIFGIFALISAMPGMIYNYLLFGSMLTTGYSGTISNYGIPEDVSFSGFSNNFLVGMWIVLLGIIIYNPILIYSIKGLLEKSTESKILLLFFLITLLLFGAWYIPYGDWCFGPRLELYMITLLSIPFAKNYEKIKKGKYFKLILALSIIIILLSQNFYFWDKQYEIMNYLVTLF